jgi:hypothetical protein
VFSCTQKARESGDDLIRCSLVSSFFLIIADWFYTLNATAIFNRAMKLLKQRKKKLHKCHLDLTTMNDTISTPS